MKSPVVLIIFNRPAMTERVFAEIRKARPPRLLIVADGPRSEHPEDIDKCRAARSVVEDVDWDCDVLKHYSQVNLGCGRRPATGITWAFEHVDEAIILEDDCVPEPSFFRFCDELLERYRDDERVFHISANNFQFGEWDTNYSYCFSCFNFSTGWATWRRAWKCYDFNVRRWPTLREGDWLESVVRHPRAAEFWARWFDEAADPASVPDYWDYQWSFACWSQSGLAILPSTTLVTNIGFGPEATHSKNPTDTTANLRVSAVTFPLHHPPCVVRDVNVDKRFVERVILPKLKKKLLRRFYAGTYSALPLPVRRMLAGAKRRYLAVGEG